MVSKVSVHHVTKGHGEMSSSHRGVQEAETMNACAPGLSPFPFLFYLSTHLWDGAAAFTQIYTEVCPTNLLSTSQSNQLDDQN
jgi:hypothetical protein